MSVPVLRFKPIADHLAAAIPAFVVVGTARDFGTITREAVRFPSAWVIPLAENAGPRQFASGDRIDQRVTVQFGVVLAVRDVADRTGTGGLTEYEAIRPALITALGQLRPAGAADVCLHQRGRLLGGIDQDGAMFWQDDFQTALDRSI